MGANYAWLNPQPKFKVYKTIEVPFFWQFNPDAGVEVISAAYFPEAFKMYKDRINRPSYPFVVNSIGNMIKFIISPIKKISAVEAAGIGYVLLKLLIFLLAGIISYNILENFLKNNYLSFLGVVLLYFHSFSIEAFATFHTYELQFISPIFFLSFYYSLSKNYSTRKNIIYSLIIGVLLLGRQNYAVYLSLLSLAIYEKQYLRSFISFLFHLVPFGLYLLFLNYNKIDYYNHEIQNYNQGFFILEYLKNYQFIDLIIEISKSVFHFIKSFATFFHIILLFLIFEIRKIKFNKKELFLIVVSIIFLYIQFLASRKYEINYMVSDIYILVIFYFLRSLKQNSFLYKNKNLLITIFCIIGLFTITNFPLRNPYNFEFRNSDVLNQRKDMIENFDEYSDKDRKNARNGVLINKEK